MDKKILGSLFALVEKLIDSLGKNMYMRCAMTLILGGLAIISAASLPVWFPFVQAIFENKFKIDITKYIDSTNTLLVVIGFIIVLLGFSLILIKKKSSPKKGLEIRHTSIEGIVNFEDNTKETIIEINQVKQIGSDLIQNALDIQNEKYSELLVILNNEKYDSVIYKALAHIPLTFLAGYQMSDKISPIYYEWNQNKLGWCEVTDNTSSYPELKSTKSEVLQSNSKNVAIKIGITYPVNDKDVLDTGILFKRIYSLSLRKPKRNSVVSRGQLMEYKAKFRDLMDDINQQNSEVRNVHIFYSGQPSLGFVLGSSISERMDKNIFVHNHTNTESIKYSWRLKLHKSDDRKNMILNGGI